MFYSLPFAPFALVQSDAAEQDAAQSSVEQAYHSLDRILREKKRNIMFDDLPETGEEALDTLDLKNGYPV